jgi:hypothetical protein
MVYGPQVVALHDPNALAGFMLSRTPIYPAGQANLS